MPVFREPRMVASFSGFHGRAPQQRCGRQSSSSCKRSSICRLVIDCKGLRASAIADDEGEPAPCCVSLKTCVFAFCAAVGKTRVKTVPTELPAHRLRPRIDSAHGHFRLPGLC